MWLRIAIVVGLVVWAVGGLFALNPLPWHIRKYWDTPGAKELRVIQAIALLLIVAGVMIFFVTDPDTFWHDLWSEMVATGGAVLGIDELNRRRSAQEYKQGIIRQMASLSNEFALDALRIAKDEEWLYDGTLTGVYLIQANLAGAHLGGARLERAQIWEANLDDAMLWFGELREANLQRSSLIRANLWRIVLIRAILKKVNFTDANLQKANLTEAVLLDANLEGAMLQNAVLEGANFFGADLRRANLTETNLRDVNFDEAIFDGATCWPEDFDPLSVGARNWDEMNEYEKTDWIRKHGHSHGEV